MFGSIKDEGQQINVHGVGLGLVICKLIVNKFNGQIDFLSKYKHGSTFYFTFEVDDPDIIQPQSRQTLTNVLHEVEPIIQDYNKIPFIQTLINFDQFRDRRILCVDDEEFCVASMSIIL